MIPGQEYAATIAHLMDVDATCLHGVSVDEDCPICDMEIDDDITDCDCADLSDCAAAGEDSADSDGMPG
jgi:hypothetical protein